MEDIENFSLGKCVAWYLVHSCLYYIWNRPVIEDVTFDAICRRLYNEFENIDHHHGYLLDKDALRAGTGYYLKEKDYPLQVQVIAEEILKGKSYLL